MKDLEKLKIQLQQLQDGKSRSSEQIQELSKQLREAKKVGRWVFYELRTILFVLYVFSYIVFSPFIVCCKLV